MSESLLFAETTLQEVALAIMTVVYISRLIWWFRFKAGKERQPETGAPSTTKAKGIVYSWANILMPWAMESTRRRLFNYLQFVLFHVGVVAAIGLSFVIPYLPGLLEAAWLVTALQAAIGAAFVVGIYRILRRIARPVMRMISSPDDYFSLVLLTTWFAFAFLAVPNQWQQGETLLLVYFWITAFFLIYVPFSKISHYLYYPFTRYWFGKSMGYRGVYPIVHSHK